MATQAFIVAPLLTLILALIPSGRRATESERAPQGDRGILNTYLSGTRRVEDTRRQLV